jgi:hypothetical protein
MVLPVSVSNRKACSSGVYLPARKSADIQFTSTHLRLLIGVV